MSSNLSDCAINYMVGYNIYHAGRAPPGNHDAVFAGDCTEVGTETACCYSDGTGTICETSYCDIKVIVRFGRHVAEHS